MTVSMGDYKKNISVVPKKLKVPGLRRRHKSLGVLSGWVSAIEICQITYAGLTVAKPCESGSSGSSFLGQLELRLLPETIVNCGHKMSLSLEDGLHRQQEKLK